MSKEEIRHKCVHGYWLMQGPCPGCGYEQGQPHAPDMVVVTGFRGRAVKRCTICGGIASASQHMVRRKPMPRRAKNTTRQGANFELKIMDDLKEHGYDVLRSSGSRGAVDVIAVSPAEIGMDGVGTLLFIQAKISQPVIPPAERLAVMNLALRAGALPLSAWRDKGTVRYRELTGPGPKDFSDWVPSTYERNESDG